MACCGKACSLCKLLEIFCDINAAKPFTFQVRPSMIQGTCLGDSIMFLFMNIKYDIFFFQLGSDHFLPEFKNLRVTFVVLLYFNPGGQLIVFLFIYFLLFLNKVCVFYFQKSLDINSFHTLARLRLAGYKLFVGWVLHMYNCFLPIPKRILGLFLPFLTKIHELNLHLEENMKNILVKNYPSWLFCF